MRVVGADKATLIATHFLEQFYTNIRLSMFGAAVHRLSGDRDPDLQIRRAGPLQERTAGLPALSHRDADLLPVGALLVYFVVMPLLIRFSVSLQQVNEPGEATIELLPKVSEYLSLIMTLIFAFGIAFQLPVVLTLLGQVGIIDSAWLSSMRRYAIVAVVGLAAILTPPDLISMISLALPMLLLYEGAVIAVKMIEKRRAADEKDKQRTSEAARHSGRHRRRGRLGPHLHRDQVRRRGDAAADADGAALRFAAFPVVLFTKPPTAPSRLVVALRAR